MYKSITINGQPIKRVVSNGVTIWQKKAPQGTKYLKSITLYYAEYSKMMWASMASDNAVVAELNKTVTRLVHSSGKELIKGVSFNPSGDNIVLIGEGVKLGASGTWKFYE